MRERNGIALSLTGVQKLGGSGKKMGKGKCLLC
jgi:hypothetical protein